MTATAEAYGFGARAPYAEPRASEYDMKERARLSGLFPRVRNEPLSKQLQGLLKEFEQNAALNGIRERRRRIEERMQYELQGREGMRALEVNRTPPLRAGMAGAATSARVAANIAGLPPAPPAAPPAVVAPAQRKRMGLGKAGLAAAKAVNAKAGKATVQGTLVQALDEDTFAVATAGKQTLNLPKVPPKQSQSSSSSSALPALFGGKG